MAKKGLRTPVLPLPIVEETGAVRIASLCREGYDPSVGLSLEDMVLRLAVALPGFLLAIVCHEAAHALVALKFGDPTARDQGRLSLNPLVHYDLFGTVILPLILLLAGGGIFGYAKPVPVNVRNFRHSRKGIFWVSFAGPLANMALALISALIMVILIQKVPASFSLRSTLVAMMQSSVLINVVLAVFNLIPWPPLDGSKMVLAFLDYPAARKYEGLQRYSFLFFLVLIMTNIFSYIMKPALMLTSSIVSFFSLIIG